MEDDISKPSLNLRHSNIQKYLTLKANRIKRLPHRPIIMWWLNISSMKKSLHVIDKKVEYLLQQCQTGGKGKLNQWFLSDDDNFINVTAERYIIDYLVSRNNNIEDNLAKRGVDAVLRLGKDEIGIEVTTLNGFIAEWILVERLTQFLDSENVIDDKTLRITYDHKRIIREKQQNRIYQYVQDVSVAIKDGDLEKLKTLDISVEFELRWARQISWHHSKAENFPWFKYLTSDLAEKISDKKKQLMNYPKNIVFVGVNHIAPVNWAIPTIFEEIGLGGTIYSSQIKSIEDFWCKTMRESHEIKGICFFWYSLDSTDPFYPLRIIWSSEAEELPINL